MPRRGAALLILAAVFVAAGMAFLRFAGCGRPVKNWNLLFISLDTTRWDHVDTGPGAKASTPALREFARRSQVFENAFTTTTQTLPSHLAVLCARPPLDLGVVSNGQKFDNRHQMLQELLQKRGYQTSAVISLGSLASASGISKGFARFREDLFSKSNFFVPAETVTDRVLELLEKRFPQPFFLFAHYSDPHTPYAPPQCRGIFCISLDGKEIGRFSSYAGAILRIEIPLARGRHELELRSETALEDFSFFTLRKMRFPEGSGAKLEGLRQAEGSERDTYQMPGSLARVSFETKSPGKFSLFQVIPILKLFPAIRLYREEVEYLDRHLGRLFRGLEKLQLAKNTIVVIFADHGEGLGERDGYCGHVRYLNRQFIHVPLIIRFPGERGRRIREAVSLTQIVPTVLKFMGIDPQALEPAPQTELIDWKNPLADSAVVSAAFAPSAVDDKLSVIDYPLQGIIYLKAGQVVKREFYNFELSQSFSARDQFFPEVLARLDGKRYQGLLRSLEKMKRMFLDPPRRGASFWHPPALDKLRTLGYLESD